MSMKPAATRQLVAALQERTDELVGRILEFIRADLPTYVLIDDADFTRAATQAMEILLNTGLQARVITDSERLTLGNHGRTRGQQGIPLPEMFSAWRIAQRTLIRELITVGRAAGVDEHELLDLTTVVMESSDAAIQEIAQGHHHAEHERVRREHQRRSDLLRGILFGTLTVQEIRIQARQYGLDSENAYHPIYARITPEVSATTLEHILSTTNSSGSTQHPDLTAVVDGDFAGILTRPPRYEIDIAIGYGSPCRLHQMEQSFQQAKRALTTAEAFGLHHPCELGRLGLLPAIAADAEIGDIMVARYVTPLGDSDGTAAILDTISRYFAYKQRADLTAKAMHLHTNTVRYRLNRYQDLTGTDLHNPEQALEIWWAIQRRQLTKNQPPLQEPCRRSPTPDSDRPTESS
ncbi:hypothetical protein FJK96_00180 [Mycobacteroides chelonae]|uniref:PucR C-terminal helix-turn-helix domain-containing protein n=2 Tax=Mycobacteroides chelonae TaxID=1774 RepID=A0AB73TVE8_MYCCH|nr:hypothetical protein FJK96_00180 [Mycobacteroides chelonae]